jgi:RimJ/RimL family protein N-acetyltransferase
MAYRNDPQVARYQGWVSVSEPAARLFIADMQRSAPGQPGEWFQFAIERKGTGELIGDCALHRESKEPRQAEIGFTLARDYQGQGYASEAVGRMIDYAFRRFKLHRVFAVTDARNTASAKLLERLGFRREGHFIQNSWFKGAWSDEFLYAILREEWERLKP